MVSYEPETASRDTGTGIVDKSFPGWETVRIEKGSRVILRGIKRKGEIT